jgi:hypothetical protein
MGEQNGIKKSRCSNAISAWDTLVPQCTNSTGQPCLRPGVWRVMSGLDHTTAGVYRDRQHATNKPAIKQQVLEASERGLSRTFEDFRNGFHTTGVQYKYSVVLTMPPAGSHP